MSSSSRSGLLAIAEEAGFGALHLFWGGPLATALSAVCSILVASSFDLELYGVLDLVDGLGLPHAPKGWL